MFKHFFKLSFKTQLVLFVSLGIIGTGASAFLYVLNSQISSFESIYFDSINTSTKTVKLGLELGLSKENFDAINQVFDWVKQDKKFVSIVLKDETNETIASFPPSFDKSAKDFDNLINSNSIYNNTYYVKENWDAKYLKGTFVIGFSTNQFYEQRKKSFKEILYVELILLSLGFVFTLYMSSKITLPLVRLQKFAEKIDSGDLSSRADENKGNKETNLVAKSVNSMVDRLLKTQLERVDEVTKFNESLGSQNKLLIDLNKEKNEFLGIVAHDLKNPLASINMSATLISSYYDKMGKDEILKRSDDIQTTANRMNELIKNLLDINRLETGKFTINISEVSINEVINEIVTNFITYSQSKNIEVKCNFDKEYLVNSDKEKLFQILENLISNAIKYSPQGKTVKIQFSLVDSFSRISVIDDGPGLSDDDKSKLFEKFTRLSAKPTGGENSTGLGLSIVKKLAQAIGGNVGCNSELGAGSEFYVDLPNSKV